MPATTETGYIIGVTQKGGTAGQSTFSFVNGRTGERFHTLSQSNDAKVNLNDTKNFPSGFQDGDVIDITGTGIKSGNAIHTVNRAKGGGKVTITMVDASTANAPAVSIG